MPSYICEFDLDVRGEDATDYLTKIARDWPALYADLPGVSRTLLLINAQGLGGEYGYLWRADIDSLSTLKTIDDALNSDDKGWRTARRDWFEHRTRVRARLTRHARGTEPSYGQGDGLIHYVLSHHSNGHGGQVRELRGSLESGWRGASGVQSVEFLTAIIQPYSGERYEAWARLADLEAFAHVSKVNDEQLAPILRSTQVQSRLYGELREVDGALVAGA